VLFRLITLLTLFSCLSLLPPAAHAQSPNYVLIKEEQGVTVYRSETHEYGKLFAFKGVTTYDAPLEKVFYVLMDNEHRVEWVDRLYVATEIDRVDAHNYVLYQAFELPAVMSNRDYVYRGIATIEPDTGVVTLHMQSIEHPNAPETVGVRANLVDSSYVLTPLENGKTQMAVEIITDPKGWLPAWLTNSIQEDWPVNTLNAIRGQLDKEYTGAYPLPPGAVEGGDAAEGEQEVEEAVETDDGEEAGEGAEESPAP
jgi:hypothetical protein